VFLPVYAYLMRRLGRDRTQRQRLQLEAAGLVALVLISVIWRAIVFWVIPESSSVHILGGYWLPANLDLFAMGMALAVTRAWSERQDRPVRAVEAIVRLDWVWWVLAFLAFHIVSMNIGLSATLEFVTGGKAYLRQFLYGLTALFLLMPIVFARTAKTK